MKSEKTVITDAAPAFDPATDTDIEAAPRKGMPAIAKAGAAAGAGLLIGGVGLALSSFASADSTATDSSDSSDSSTATESTDSPADAAAADTLSDGKVDFAAGVDDSMSFAKAFATARREVGAGGAFVWHGGVYGTYTAEEWNGMTAAQRSEYASHFDWNHISAQPQTQPADPAHAAADTHADTTAHESQAEVISIVDDREGGHQYVTQLVDGHEAVMIDTDGDGILDTGVVDRNDNGEIDADEVEDISALGLTIDSVAQATGVEITVTGTPDELLVEDEVLEEEEVISIVDDREGGLQYVTQLVDGHDAVMVDTDGDGILDTGVVDRNDNGEIDADEVEDISALGLTIDSVAQATGVEITVTGTPDALLAEDEVLEEDVLEGEEVLLEEEGEEVLVEDEILPEDDTDDIIEVAVIDDEQPLDDTLCYDSETADDPTDFSDI